MLNHALFKAVTKKDSAQVQALIKRGVAVNELDERKQTPLLKAIFNKDLLTIQILIAAGANVNHDETAKLSPLQVAIFNYPECILLLEAHGARFETQLHEAIYRQEASMLNTLLEGGIAIDSLDSGGSTPFIYAAGLGKITWLKKLIEYGVNPRVRTNNGHTALISAAYNGHLEVVQWLVLEAKVSPVEKDNNGTTALIGAAYNGHLEVVKWLRLEAKTSLSERDNNGTTVLISAAYNGHLELVKWLVLEAKASLAEKNNKGMTALISAVYNGHLEVVKWLVLEAKASLTERNNEGDTVLISAAYNGHLEVVKWLVLEVNVSLSEKSNDGDTALLLASYNGYLEVVQWLVMEAKVSLAERNNYGDTAQELSKYHPDLFHWLNLYEALDQAKGKFLSRCIALDRLTEDKSERCKTMAVQSAIIQLLVDFNQPKLLSIYVNQAQPNEALAVLKKKYLRFVLTQAYQYAITIRADRQGTFYALIPELQALIFSFLLPLSTHLGVTIQEQYQAFKNGTSAAIKAIQRVMDRRSAKPRLVNEPNLSIKQSFEEFKPLSFSSREASDPNSMKQKTSASPEEERQKKRLKGTLAK